jgi:clan AA aspartic protease (TIGR02281 family)
MNRHLLPLITLFLLSVALLACAGYDAGRASYNRDAYAGLNQGEAAYARGDYVKAYKEFKALAEQGDARMQFKVGQMNVNGTGVPQDNVEAVKWYHMAAEQGHGGAQIFLARMYAKGIGVERNSVEAAKWYRMAAEQGYTEAQDALEAISHTDTPVPNGEADAGKWGRKAADRRDVNVGGRSTEIRLEKRGGVYELPVRINGVISLNFILDTGAAEVNIPADVALTLFRTGTISQKDFLPGKSYQLADGSILKSKRFIIRELDMGGIKITQVPASIGPATASLLLGQSFLGRLESWSLDNQRHVFIIRGVK